MGFLDDEIDSPGPGSGPPHGRKGRPGPEIRYGAIGEAWGLLMRRPGTWALAVLIAGTCNAALGEALGVPIHRAFGTRVQFGGGLPIAMRRLSQPWAIVPAALVYGLFLGGMFRMACNQVRGRPIGLGDLFGVADCLLDLALASVLVSLATLLGTSCLVLPGLVVSALLMFTLPLVVDGRLRALDAMARSWGALKSRWLEATVFHVVLAAVSGLGALVCCVGLLATAPLYSLTIAILYRDNFLAPAYLEKAT